jgi:hypothetical protein
MTSETLEAEESEDERAERNVEDERYADGEPQDVVRDEQYADGEDQDAVRDEQYADGEPQDAVRDGQYADVDTCHLDDVADGCGCAEVWEHTSGQRAAEGDAGAD